LLDDAATGGEGIDVTSRAINLDITELDVLVPDTSDEFVHYDITGTVHKKCRADDLLKHKEMWLNDAESMSIRDQANNIVFKVSSSDRLSVGSAVAVWSNLVGGIYYGNITQWQFGNLNAGNVAWTLTGLAPSGSVTIAGGAGIYLSDDHGGLATLKGGIPANGGYGGSVAITAEGGYNEYGGSVAITAGDGAKWGSGDHDGGDVDIGAGSGSGTGADGVINLDSNIDMTGVEFASNVDLGGNNIVDPGTVDGRDVATDGSKLDTIAVLDPNRNTADETRNNTVALTPAANVATWTLEANKVYKVTGALIFSGATAADVQFGFTGPVGCTTMIGYGALRSTSSAFAGAVEAFNTGYRVNTWPADPKSSCRLGGTIEVGGTGGTLTLVWAQFVATAADCTLHEGSYIEVTEIL
jgi:hypothetical protein